LENGRTNLTFVATNLHHPLFIFISGIYKARDSVDLGKIKDITTLGHNPKSLAEQAKTNNDLSPAILTNLEHLRPKKWPKNLSSSSCSNNSSCSSNYTSNQSTCPTLQASRILACPPTRARAARPRPTTRQFSRTPPSTSSQASRAAARPPTHPTSRPSSWRPRQLATTSAPTCSHRHLTSRLKTPTTRSTVALISNNNNNNNTSNNNNKVLAFLLVACPWIT